MFFVVNIYACSVISDKQICSYFIMLYLKNILIQNNLKILAGVL